MKKIFYLPIAVVILAFTTQSCSTSKNTLSFGAPTGKAYHDYTTPKSSSQDEIVAAEEIVETSPSMTSSKTIVENTPLQEVVVAEESAVEKSIEISELTKESKKELAKEAKEYFKSLDKKERKEIKKEIKAQMKTLKSDKSVKTSDIDPVILAVLSIIFPLAPLMMYLYQGEINEHFWISLILTILGWLPGVIYNFIIMLG